MADQKEYKKGGVDYQPGRMQKSFDQWVDEERQEHQMSDESTEGGEAASGGGVVTEVVPEPKAKTPEELAQNPKEVLEGDQPASGGEGASGQSTATSVVDKGVVDKMGTQAKFSSPDPKGLWNAITHGKTHKIGACMEHMQGKVSDAGAFCNWLAQENGYKPE